MKRRTLFAAGAAAAVMPVARMAFAQAAAPDARMQEILLGGNFSLLSSRLAAEKATDPAVKAFAALEVAEQEAVARAFGAAPSDQVAPEHATMLEQMNAMEAGAEFDRQYLTAQMQGHEQLRALHAAYAENGENPMARGASIVGVPAIDSHMSMLRAISNRMG
ncbi:DUF4142 domain-containing protein [Paracoccus sp. WLY502]|uniref:DUF4142 domain-containing protein n=1 Tax=Paracoccus yibinensis TaxID=3068891 RepID=UPI0027966CD9|nr:DUF4142 domain-containing protein [Paracoccus sp. WLY502]MDQ1900520.1 DUF4142 domain-containing protein [Paracoccus sp. WLY502]